MFNDIKENDMLRTNLSSYNTLPNKTLGKNTLHRNVTAPTTASTAPIPIPNKSTNSLPVKLNNTINSYADSCNSVSSDTLTPSSYSTSNSENSLRFSSNRNQTTKMLSNSQLEAETQKVYLAQDIEQNKAEIAQVLADLEQIEKHKVQLQLKLGSLQKKATQLNSGVSVSEDVAVFQFEL